MMILNLTQHQATAAQLAAGVIDLPDEKRTALIDALTVTTLPDRESIEARCDYIAELACQNGLGDDETDDPHPRMAMIGGAPWLMSTLEQALTERGITPLYAFSVRESTERTLPDGTVQKINVFKHAGFVGL